MFELTRRNNNPVAEFYRPFREMEEFEKRFFANPFDGFFAKSSLGEFRTDITEEGDHFLLEAELPGFSKENIQLKLNGDTLTIQASRSSQNEEKDKENKMIRRERSYGSYTRQFDISGIDSDGIKGKYEDGVLKLILPKKEAASPAERRIEIE